MSYELLKQPDGQLALFDTVSGDFVMWDSSPADYRIHTIQDAVEAALERAEQDLAAIEVYGTSWPGSYSSPRSQQILAERDARLSGSCDPAGFIEPSPKLCASFGDWLSRMRSTTHQ